MPTRILAGGARAVSAALVPEVAEARDHDGLSYRGSFERAELRRALSPNGGETEGAGA